jgi:hypothetical protein
LSSSPARKTNTAAACRALFSSPQPAAHSRLYHSIGHRKLQTAHAAGTETDETTGSSCHQAANDTVASSNCQQYVAWQQEVACRVDNALKKLEPVLL